jgi:hypothetical protein
MDGMFRTQVITYAWIMKFVKRISQVWLHIAIFLLHIQIKIEISMRCYHIVCSGTAYSWLYIMRRAQTMFILGVAHSVTKVPLRDFMVPRNVIKKHMNQTSSLLLHLPVAWRPYKFFSNFFPFILILENSRLSTWIGYGEDSLEFGWVGLG